jgi:hypothetical protein
MFGFRPRLLHSSLKVSQSSLSRRTLNWGLPVLGLKGVSLRRAPFQKIRESVKGCSKMEDNITPIFICFCFTLYNVEKIFMYFCMFEFLLARSLTAPQFSIGISWITTSTTSAGIPISVQTLVTPSITFFLASFESPSTR